MNVLGVVVLLYCLGVVAFDGLTGKTEFMTFKLSQDTLGRQRFYLRWLLKSLLLFLVGGLLGLTMLGHRHNLAVFPSEFGAAHIALVKLVPQDQLSHEFLVGLGYGVLGAVLMGSVIAGLMARTKKQALVLGDIEVLMPRNGAEMLRTAVLSLNAGLSEEIFFRLLLPLVLVTLFGHALACFAAAAVLFGVPHLYQGVAGALAATFVGLVLTVLYVATERIWIVILIHAAIDLNTLVLRPAIGWMIESNRPAAA